MKKLVKTFTVIFLVFSMIIGCATVDSGNNGGTKNTGTAVSNEGGATDGTEKKNEEKLTINMAAQYWSGPRWGDDHPTIKYLNDKFNVDIKLQLINGSEFNEKLRVMAASGSLPDFYRVDGATFIEWQSEGAFADLAGLLPKYKNLNEAYPPSIPLSVLNPEGKLYGIPEISWIVRDSVQVREDWLKNIGMEVPSADEFTLDKFYEIAKAFATQDPDQNGVVGDTIGFSGDIKQLMNAFGIANQWIEKDGQLIPQQLQVDEYKEYLTFMKKAYDEGVLDRDFVLRKTVEIQDLVKANRIGLFFYHNTYVTMAEDIKKAFPETDPVVVPMAPPIGPTGLRGNSNNAVGMSKQVINAKAGDAKIDRILQILDWWVTEEGTQIMKNGVDGVHYVKNAEGKYEVTEKWEADVPRHLNSNLFKRPGTDFNLYLWTSEEEYARHEAYTALVEAYPWPNAAMGLEFYSETNTNKGADLRLKFDEAVLKIIVGAEPIGYIEQASADYLANGGEQIIKEINEAAKR